MIFSITPLEAQLATSISRLDGAALTHLMQAGVNANSSVMGVPALHSCLLLWNAHRTDRISDIAEGLSQITGRKPASAAVTASPENAQKARGMALILMSHGARLDHADPSGLVKSPINDTMLWRDAGFGAEVMVAALYCAATRKESLPRFTLSEMGIAVSTINPLDPKPAQYIPDHAYSRQIVQNVRRQVGLQLTSPKDPLAAKAAELMNDHQRAYWTNSEPERMPKRAPGPR